MELIKDIGIPALFLLMSIIGYFLKQKDEQQEKQISARWAKHDEDVKMLAALKERVDRDYYAKTEADTKFQAMREEMRESFHKLEAKMDNLIQAVLQCNRPIGGGK